MRLADFRAEQSKGGPNGLFRKSYSTRNIRSKSDAQLRPNQMIVYATTRQLRSVPTAIFIHPTRLASLHYAAKRVGEQWMQQLCRQWCINNAHVSLSSEPPVCFTTMRLLYCTHLDSLQMDSQLQWLVCSDTKIGSSHLRAWGFVQRDNEIWIGALGHIGSCLGTRSVQRQRRGAAWIHALEIISRRCFVLLAPPKKDSATSLNKEVSFSPSKRVKQSFIHSTMQREDDATLDAMTNANAIIDSCVGLVDILRRCVSL